MQLPCVDISRYLKRLCPSTCSSQLQIGCIHRIQGNNCFRRSRRRTERAFAPPRDDPGQPHPAVSACHSVTSAFRRPVAAATAAASPQLAAPHHPSHPAPACALPEAILQSYESYDMSPSPVLQEVLPQGHNPTAGPRLVVFSGGTAWNSVAGSLRHYTTRVSHVLPVSDDGGSTAEIVRVLGGPAVGDIRSRCLRLADDSNEEARAVRRLLAHRLPALSPEEAKEEWYRIVEGEHPLWEGVSEPYKHTIRAFLVHFHTEILRHSSERFNFQNGSVGNFFFAGARLFFRSLEAAIFLFARVARLPEGSLVLPSICTEERITLGAQLENGIVIRGQNEISHPSIAGSPCFHLVDKISQLPPLEAPIRRIFYLSHEGTHREHEVNPPTNKTVLHEVELADAVVYAMGSLYTSIVPNLILQGVGEAVAASSAVKVLILNGTHDRETGCCARTGGIMAASDVVEVVCNMLNRTHTRTSLTHPASSYVSVLLVPRNGEIQVDCERLAAMGIREIVAVDSHMGVNGQCLYDADALVAALRGVLLSHGK